MQTSLAARRSLMLGTALLLAAPALSMPAVAQEAAATDVADESLRQDAITVYGTANPIPAFDYPGQVAVITREQIDVRAPSSISDLLRDVAGLEFEGGPRRSGEGPTLRGQRTDNVLILLDGARQSFSSVHDGRFFIDPDLIGRAEVVKGPASALYGSGAVGGVLAFETVTAEQLLRDGETWGARARLGWQDVSGESLVSLTGFTRRGAFDGLASLGFRDSGDIRLGTGADLPSEDSVSSALLKGSYAFSDALKVDASWQRFANEAIEPNNGQGTLGTGDSTLDREVVKNIETETLRAGVSFAPVGSTLINARAVAYRTVTSVDEFDATVPRSALREIETTGFSIRNSSRFELGSYLTVVTIGADAYRDEQTGRDTTVAGQVRPGVPNGESEFTGAFIQSETRIDTGVGEFLIIPGVRYDRFESTSTLAPGQANKDSEVSPRIGVTYLPTEWLTVFGTRSQGFRAPSINELYLDGVHFNVPHPVLGPRSGVFATNRFVSNPNLVPEHATTEEFGFGVDFKSVLTTGDRLQGKFTRYESDVTDLIDLRIDFAFSPTCFAPPRFTPCAAGTSTSANVKRAELDGWDFDVSYLNGPLSLNAAYGQIEGTNPLDGSSIGSLTPDRLTLTGSWLFAAQDLRVGARLEAAERFRRDITSARADFVTVDARDAYQVIDLFASWTPEALNGVRIDAGIDNLLDENYERVFVGVSEPGRNVKVALSWQFGG